MKFLCVDCDQRMVFEERQLPGDGTLAVAFRCPACGRTVALLTNPWETQLVSSLGVIIGGRTVPEQPMELTRTTTEGGREGAFADAEPGEERRDSTPGGAPARVTWDDRATQRLANVPSFVRGMVKRIYADYALERGIAVITPEVMDAARSDLGLEGM
ncbi:MAG: hypothetical protein HYR48_00705 [Gemmatimonadetes bacterium]|nr:hypothetical protein [Gemmatimonadota bacterium]